MINDNFIVKYLYYWWKNLDKYILTLITLLFILGLFFSLASTSLIASDKLNTNSYYFFFKHLIYMFIGIIFIITFSIIDNKNLIKMCWILFVISFLALLLVPILGIEVKGSKRWLDLPFLPRFQPIEILKPFAVMIIAILLGAKNFKSKYLNYFLSLFVLIPILLFLVIQPDIGQSFLLIITWLCLVFVSGINIFFFSSFIILSILTLSFLISFVPRFFYIRDRITSFIDPANSDNTFQADKASEAIINGGFFGRGIGEGILKNNVPEAHTDYIIAVISEEFGAIVIILLMFIFLIFIYAVLKKVINEKDNSVKLALLGLITLIAFQSLIHIGVNLRMFPTTGMTLPFLSYGGSSIVGTSILSGIILNLTKRKIN